MLHRAQNRHNTLTHIHHTPSQQSNEQQHIFFTCRTTSNTDIVEATIATPGKMFGGGGGDGRGGSQKYSHIGAYSDSDSSDAFARYADNPDMGRNALKTTRCGKCPVKAP